jgi:adenylate cyclase
MPKVTYFQGESVTDAPDGQTLLDISIRGRIPHYHQCGGRGRCTTCRVLVMDGISHLSPRSPIEARVAEQRGWNDFIRLACQTKVHGDVVIRPLIENPQDIIVLDIDELHGAGPGEGKELDVAILMADVRNFTTFAEKNLPYDVVHLLNRLFTAIAEPVLNNNGFVDKYVGDGVLAAFGARAESPATTCRNAVRTALLMQEAAARLRPVFEEAFDMKLRMGVGVHFGTVILGRLGHPGKRQVTVIGDAVNLASRIESMTKECDEPILVSDSVVAHLPGELAIRPVATAQLKGRVGATVLYA